MATVSKNAVRFAPCPILIKSGGDLASGVAYRLKRAGFPVLITELAIPVMVRRTVCFGEAVYSREITVEGVTAKRVESAEEAVKLAYSEMIPVLIDPVASVRETYQPQVLIDGIMAKRNTGTQISDAPMVIALGPGFTAGEDCHAVIETNRGHWLGRVIYRGTAEPDTGSPGTVRGFTGDRVLRAPTAGYVASEATIGDALQQGDLIARVADQDVRAPFDGVLRGLVHSSVPVTEGFKIGDLDPRGVVEHCFTLSDKSLAIGGGVLEAVLASEVMREAAR